MKSNPGRRKSPKQTVACRLEDEYREALLSQAAAREIEMSELIREYIIDGLCEKEADARLYELLHRIFVQLCESRRDHSLIAEALLSCAGKLDPEKAHRWAVENIPAE